MPENREAVRLDFSAGLSELPPRPAITRELTAVSVAAGHSLGFKGRPTTKIDGRTLRRRGNNTQLNVKISQTDKDMILLAASELIDNPSSPIQSVGEYIVFAVNQMRGA